MKKHVIEFTPLKTCHQNFLLHVYPRHPDTFKPEIYMLLIRTVSW